MASDAADGQYRYGVDQRGRDLDPVLARLVAASDANAVIVSNAIDPTETSTKRKSFRANFGSRWREVRGRNRDYLERLDTLADPTVLERYRDWFTTLAMNNVVEPMSDRNVRRGYHWTGSFIRTSYQKGLALAEDDLLAAGYDADAVTTATRFRHAQHRRHVGAEYLKMYYSTEDTTMRLRSEMAAIMVEGMETDRSSRWVANEANRELRRAARNASNANVNEAVVQAVNEALLTAFELVGVEQVGVQIEAHVQPNRENYAVKLNAPDGVDVAFTTAGDDAVCSDCAALDGQMIPVDEVRRTGIAPPIHPNCRCRLVPV